LDSAGQADDDLRYALCEILQYERAYPANGMEEQIERVRQYFSGTDAARSLKALAAAQDLSIILREIADSGQRSLPASCASGQIQKNREAGY
jgi:hypothetical protein